MQHDRSNGARMRRNLGISLVARFVVVVAALGIFAGSAYAHPVARPSAPVRRAALRRTGTSRASASVCCGGACASRSPAGPWRTCRRTRASASAGTRCDVPGRPAFVDRTRVAPLLRSAIVWTLARRGLRRALPRDLSPRARLRALDGVARGRRRRGRRDVRDRLAPAARHPAQRRAGLADRRHAPRPGQRAAQPPARRCAARAARPPAAHARARSRRARRGRRAARRAARALAAGPRGHRADGLVRPVRAPTPRRRSASRPRRSGCGRRERAAGCVPRTMQTTTKERPQWNTRPDR